MGHLVIRGIPEQVLDGLQRRAARHGRSVEDEAHAILVQAISMSGAMGFGQMLRAQFADCQGNELDVKRDQTPGEAAEFET